MVQGTMSGAGKSLLVTALCRIFRQDGLRSAPFKSQNMSLNSFITRDGAEIGRAQAAQAEAAGREADARMNPVLLKPSSDVGSQLIVNGTVRGDYQAMDYMKRKKMLIPDIMDAYRSLEADSDVMIIEGAGSPAEINLKDDDIVNMGLADLIDAPVILVGDIDRGGVFAQLYGTAELLEPSERDRIIGFVINKFRGDPEILKPGLTMLEEKTGIPVIGLIPYVQVDLDDEDSLSERLDEADSAGETRQGTTEKKPVDIAIIRLPRLSNFTDFAPLNDHPALSVRYVRKTSELGHPDLIILPGTKNAVGDLLWLRQCGLETAIIRQASDGTPVMGICGGYQMLGMSLWDPQGVEGSGAQEGPLRGMGLLPCDTVFSDEKVRRQVAKSTVTAAPFTGAQVYGYEIHMGCTTRHGAEGFANINEFTGSTPAASDTEAEKDNSGSDLADGAADGTVFGTYLHGLFDSGDMVQRMADWLLDRKGISWDTYRPEDRRTYRDRQYDLLADTVRSGLDMDRIYAELRRQEDR